MNEKILNVTIFNLCNKIIKDLFVENASIFISYRSELADHVNNIKKNYNRGSINYYHDSNEFTAINPYLMEMTGDAFNHWVVSINNVILDLVDEVLGYTSNVKKGDYYTTDKSIKTAVFKKKLTDYVDNKLKDNYNIQREYVEQGLEKLQIITDTYQKSNWITSLDYGIKSNDIIISNLDKLINTISFLKGYRRQFLSYTEKVYDSSINYDDYMEVLLNEADFYEFYMSIYIKLQQKINLMLSYLKVRARNYRQVLVLTDAIIIKEYPVIAKEDINA